MVIYKNEIAKLIGKATNIDVNDLEAFIEIPNNRETGDYAFPCFKLAKTLTTSL